MPRGVYNRSGSGAATAMAREKVVDKIAKLEATEVSHAERVVYLANLWVQLKAAFNLPLPNVCVTMGFTSRRARSRASNRAPGEILVKEWKGSEIETALVSIHPERFKDVQQVARAVLFVIGNEVYGSRRNLGSLTLGISLDKESGDLQYTPDEKGKHAETTLTAVIKHLGTIPKGFAEMPEPAAKKAQQSRNRLYVCSVCKTKIRTAGTTFRGLCLHGGTPNHGEMATEFAEPAPPKPSPEAPKEVKEPKPEETSAVRAENSGMTGRMFQAQ